MTLVPSFIDYDRLIRGYVKLATGLQHVIQANINYPSPAIPYATVLMIDNDKIGTNWQLHSYNSMTDNLDSEYTSQHTMQYRVQVYNTEDAQSILRQLVAYYDVPDGDLYLKSNGIYYLNSTSIKRIDLIQNSKYETRASVELNFMLISKIVTETNRIISSQIDVSLQSSDIINSQINVEG